MLQGKMTAQAISSETCLPECLLRGSRVSGDSPVHSQWTRTRASTAATTTATDKGTL